jgi:hypothetical protein
MDAEPAASHEPQGLSRWLEEAWRHGEIVADHDGVLLERSDQPRPDRFRPSHAEPADPRTARRDAATTAHTPQH